MRQSLHRWEDQMMILFVTLITCLAVGMVQGYATGSHIAHHDPPKGLTCWTCPNKTDNEECNDWAPERHCPDNHTICKTVQRINTRTGESVVVNKLCVAAAECEWAVHVGCSATAQDGVEDCVSCCNFDYCNELSPTNHTEALLFSISVKSSAANTKVHALSMFLPAILTILLIAKDIGSTIKAIRHSFDGWFRHYLLTMSFCYYLRPWCSLSQCVSYIMNCNFRYVEINNFWKVLRRKLPGLLLLVMR